MYVRVFMFENGWWFSCGREVDADTFDYRKQIEDAMNTTKAESILSITPEKNPGFPVISCKHVVKKAHVLTGRSIPEFDGILSVVKWFVILELEPRGYIVAVSPYIGANCDRRLHLANTQSSHTSTLIETMPHPDVALDKRLQWVETCLTHGFGDKDKFPASHTDVIYDYVKDILVTDSFFRFR